MTASFRQDLVRLLRDISRAEELADRLCYNYCELVAAILAKGQVAKNPFNPGVTVAGFFGIKPILKPGAAAGVSEIKSVARGDGSRVVHVDGRAGVPLTGNLADLLEVLKADTGDSPDLFVSWKSLGVVVDRLKACTGRNLSGKAVRQLIYRLRNQLEYHGENRLLVQSDRRLGYRFALRRGAGSIVKEACDAL